jgi:tetratricopeptide (TPR) repeat protein
VYVAASGRNERTPTSAGQPASSAEGLLDQAEHALDEGDTTLAGERVARAEAMARSPRMLLDRARIDAAIADVSWLQARLATMSEAERARAAPLFGAARVSADAAMAAAPNDPAAARAKLDALRIAGDLEGARALVPRLAAIGEQAETAYVSAALELAEDAPVSLGAIARLREAVASGRQATRTRSALAYALARSSDRPGARHEIDALAAKTSDAPLLDELRAFVARPDRAAGKPSVPVVASSELVHIGPSSASTATPTTPAPTMSTAAAHAAPPAGTVPAATTPAAPTTPSTLPAAKVGAATMDAALAAQKAGDLPRADALYRALLEKNPRDVEVMTALGDVARAQGHGRDAIAYYRRALVLNASFYPALLGLADTLWESGERVAAQQRYSEITTRFSPAMYPTYVRRRLATDAGVERAP